MDKKFSAFNIVIFCGLVLATAIPFSAKSQEQSLNVITKNKIYRRQSAADSNHLMIEVKSRIPSIVYDLRYATAHNFTGEVLYEQGKVTFLRLPVVHALQQVQRTLNEKGWGLKIFDAYRPYAVTQKMWTLVHDERYVANPAKGSGHNRGLAVDVTLIDLKTGNEQDMGTGFDNFTDTAHHSFQNLQKPILQNRMLLKQTMEAAGFKALETEWWHYYWPNDRKYDVLNLDFKKLQKMQR